jgi:hypothetical protein
MMLSSLTAENGDRDSDVGSFKLMSYEDPNSLSGFSNFIDKKVNCLCLSDASYIGAANRT